MNKNKILQLLFCACTICLISCGDEDVETKNAITKDSFNLVGIWYDESVDEEVVYYDDGIYFDTFCTYEYSGCTEGHYSLIGDKLTETYSYLGDSRRVDFTVSDYSEYSFTIYSDKYGKHTYKKVVSTISLSVGDMVEIPMALNKTFDILDSRLLKVEGGNIVSLNQKGKTYIRINEGEDYYYIKVLCDVDDYFYDYWYDYTKLLGSTESEMKRKIGANPVITENKDGFMVAIYSNMNDLSAYVSSVNLFFDNNKIAEIQVKLHDDVSEKDIQDYLSKKFFAVSLQGNQYFYHSKNNVSYKDEIAIIVFDRDRKMLIIYENKDNMTDLSYQLKMSKADIKKENKNNLLNGEDYERLIYEVNDNSSNISDIYYFFESSERLCTAIGVKYVESASQEGIFTTLENNYEWVRMDFDSGEGYYIFRNRDKTIEINYYPDDNTLIYYDLTSDILPWPDYSKTIGMKSSQILSEYCPNPYDKSNEEITYIPFNYFVGAVMFYLDENGYVYRVGVKLNDSLLLSDVLDYYNSIYTVFEGGTDEEQQKYAWINASARENATVGIIYYADSGVVYFLQL